MSKLEKVKDWYLKDDWWHFIIGLTVIYLLGLILELTGYWWTMIIAAAVGGVIIKHGGKAIIAGFVGIFLVWSTYLISIAGLGYSNPYLFLTFLDIIGSVIGISGGFLVIICLLLGGLIGLVGAVNAAYIAQIIIKYTVKEDVKTDKKVIAEEKKVIA